MPARLSVLALLFLGATFARSLVGCRPAEPPPTPAEATANSNAGPEQAARGAENDDPAEELNRLFADLATGRSVAAAFPERYRRDIDRFLRDTVRPIAPDARRRAADAVARFADALREKEAFVLASARFEIAGPAAGAVRDRFGLVCRLVAVVARADIWGAPDVGDSDSAIGAIASAIGKSQTLMSELKGIRFEPVSRTGDAASVRVRSGSEAAGRELSVVRIDGAWVPATVADRWRALFSSSDSAPQSSDQAAQLVSLAARLDEVTTALAAVSTQEQFDALADEAATRLLATAAQADRRPRPVSAEEFVTVEVLGPLTDDQKDRIVWDLGSRTDSPASGLADAADRPDGQGVVITVGPVDDISVFAKRLTGLKIERVDAQKKTVTARFVGP